MKPPVPLQGADRDAWESALGLWGVRMHDATLRPGAGARMGAPAWFSFPPSVTVDPAMVRAFGGGDEMESVFAHELGHHVLAPSTRLDSLKIRHQMARALIAAGAPSVVEADVALLANLWNDLLVNTRLTVLQRQRDGAGTEPGIVRLSRAAFASSRRTQDRLWWVYLRAYELLWNLPTGTLCTAAPPAPAPPPPAPAPPLRTAPKKKLRAKDAELSDKEAKLQAARAEAERVAAELSSAITTQPALDADQIARSVRTFGGDAVGGALRFGVIAAPYLVERAQREPGGPGDGAGDGVPVACDADDAPATPGEMGRVLADPRVRAPVPQRIAPTASGIAAGDRAGAPAGQQLDVARTLELYADADPEAVMAAWYRSEAAPWVTPMRQRLPARPQADLVGPLETWESGDDLADLDWPATLSAGAVVIPGVTTRRRSFLDDEPVPADTAIELDVYLDSSGSMPSPRRGSPAVLAGMILGLSVLRGGGRVRVTSFSGPGQVAGMEDFTRDPARVAGGLTAYFGGATSFPLDLLDRRYAPLRPPTATERRHLVVLSDDGLSSMFGVGNEPYTDVAARTRPKLTTATLVLPPWGRGVESLAEGAGYDVLIIDGMDEAPVACAIIAEELRG